MSGGATLASLQCAATAVLLSFAATSVARLSAAIFLLCAGAASLMSLDQSWTATVLIANAVGIIVCGLPIHLARGVSAIPAILISACTGGLAGLALATADRGSSSFVLALILLFVVGQRLVAAGYAIVPKVASGWLIAIAILSAALPIVSTPGNLPDHMD